MFQRIFFLWMLVGCTLHSAFSFDEEACEGAGAMRVWCGSNEAIRITDAFWGRTNTVTCPHDTANTNSTTCMSPSFLQQVIATCGGRNECKVPTSTSVLGDPCPGIYKYASVTFECTACTNVLDDVTCTTRARRGECEDVTTREDMMSNCFQACSRCEMFNQPGCDNIYGSESSESRNTLCDQWAFDGECYANPDWMLANCKESCRTCQDEYNTTVRGCEGELEYLRCDESYFLQVNDVKYGRFDDSFCQSDLANETCPVSSEALERLRSPCDGNHDCTLRVTNAALDPRDPCEGQPKQVEVMYDCRLCQNSNNTECTIRANRQECLFNRNYMMENCFKECSGCKEADCANDENDADCDYWAMRGECETNPDWMDYNCAKSCHKCDCRNEANDGRCEFWESIGECDTNPWMTYNCAKACQTCAENSACINPYGNDGQCERWASAGECNANPFWMLYQCARACFACGDSIGPFSRNVCEGVRTNLHCDNPNQKVRITDLFYGRRNNDTCPHETFDPSTTCNASSNSYDDVTGQCNGKSECWVLAGGYLFGDPCSGVTKQLEATFTCQDCSNSAGDEACAARVANGECSSDPETMLDDCFQACTMCRTTECENLDEDRNCDVWAIAGECQANPDYMLTQCARSCHQDCS